MPAEGNKYQTFSIGFGSCKKSISLIKKFILTLAVLIPAFGFSQVKISGQVADSETGLPLVGAHVRMDGITSYQMVSDNRGAFSFENVPKGSYEIRVSFVGYQTYKERLAFKEDAHLSIDIKEGCSFRSVRRVHIRDISQNEQRRNSLKLCLCLPAPIC